MSLNLATDPDFKQDNAIDPQNEQRVLTWKMRISGAPFMVKISFTFICLMVFLAIFAQAISPHDIAELDLLNRFAPPVFMGGSWSNILGTDNLGHDVFSLCLRGIQISLAIAAIGTLVGAIFGTSLGFIAAWAGGWIDDFIGILIDFQAAIPFLVMALALLAVMPQADITLFILIMCIYGWERYARLARSVALSAKNDGYVTAQTILGASAFRTYLRHVLPNTMAVIVVNMTINFPSTILAESSLNFLGIGIQPPDTSLGVLIGIGRDYLYKAPWLALTPGFIILFITLAISIVGDWTRDQLDVD
ncbi:MAG: peptide ABC transporter permease [Hyphomicrobiales bacterium]|nr:MAG: peptide ABC transporter permease [Hyphomicrobiales bacterium]